MPNPTPPDPSVIRLRRSVGDLIDAGLSVQYGLANLPVDHPARCEWGRIAQAFVSWSHDMRDYLEETE